MELYFRNRTLKAAGRREIAGTFIGPAVRVHNWFPRNPFYHLSFSFFVWSLDVWWMKRG